MSTDWAMFMAGIAIGLVIGNLIWMLFYVANL
jgi:hypothetical protein